MEFFQEIYDLYRQAGIGPAMHACRGRAFPEVDRRAVAQAFNEANAIYWFEHELRHYPPVDLEIGALADHVERILPAVGREACNYSAHEAAVVLGRKIGRDVAELPGGHIGCIAHPAGFARDVMQLLS